MREIFKLNLRQKHQFHFPSHGVSTGRATAPWRRIGVAYTGRSGTRIYDLTTIKQFGKVQIPTSCFEQACETQRAFSDYDIYPYSCVAAGESRYTDLWRPKVPGFQNWHLRAARYSCGLRNGSIGAHSTYLVLMLKRLALSPEDFISLCQPQDPQRLMGSRCRTMRESTRDHQDVK